uniref:Uncharacterized protein n=1 Tax=Sinocyclocheilus anshuiensis TaxID=1608454 RepID=A0A671NZ08_9TELE
MESVLYCTIEEQSTDKLKTSESVLSCVRETIIDVNTSRENIIVCTQLRKDNVDASNPVQRKDCISERVLEGGRATVLKPMLPCMYAQDTLSLKLTNGLEKVQKVNQCMHRNAQVVDNKTERNKSGLASMEMKNASSEDILACVEDHAQPFEDTVPQTRDSAMHFASSDINPFIHSKTTMGVNTAIHKKQAFGSAANISCKHSSLNCSNKNMTRCCSVDNGLNIQDSPFCSHLSTYVNHKGLSSTLSSNEYSKYQISSEPLLKAASHSSSGSKKQTLTVLKCDSYNCASAELRHSSGQVGEIVLVYSSEYESQEHPSPSRCDHGTQTIEVNKDLKRKSRHRRSSTQTPVSKPGNGALTTWASLQNMSEHLSDLIVNTSDLLGNIQGMRTGEKPPKYDHPEHCFQVSTVHSCSNFKKDCSTQTSLDIGIQTEDAPVSKNAMAHEVNVIVKVIGSNTCNVSQLDGDAKILKNKCESEQAFERIKSLTPTFQRFL